MLATTITAETISTSTLKNNIIPFNTPIKAKVNQSGRLTNKTVDPIKSKEVINQIKDFFLTLSANDRYKNNYTNIRNYMMWCVGINIGRRAGDLLKLTFDDVLDSDGTFREQIIIREEKTSKKCEFYLNNSAKEAITRYINCIGEYKPTDYLFKSRNGENKPITVHMAWTILNDMSKALELKCNVGSHTMRKITGYHIVNDNPNNPYIITLLSEIYNHSSVACTRRYLGFDKEERRNIYLNNNL